MKGLILTAIILSVPLGGLLYWLYRPRLFVLKTRLGRALKVAGVLYLAIIAYRLSTSSITPEQLQVAGLSLAFFAGVWVVAWIITRSLASRR